MNQFNISWCLYDKTQSDISTCMCVVCVCVNIYNFNYTKIIVWEYFGRKSTRKEKVSRCKEKQMVQDVQPPHSSNMVL